MSRVLKAASVAVVVLAGTLPASTAAMANHGAQCATWKSSNYGYTKHKARQKSIIGVNTKFNRSKASAIGYHGDAASLNAYIRNKGNLRPIQIDCTRSGSGYKCHAVKKWCRY